jgi:hypothetical protein
MANFVPNPSGIIEVCKSAGMQAELAAQGAKLAAKASGDALAKKGRLREIALKNHKIDLDTTKDAAYYAKVDTLKYTAVCKVANANLLGDLAENQYKSLSRISR